MYDFIIHLLDNFFIYYGVIFILVFGIGLALFEKNINKSLNYFDSREDYENYLKNNNYDTMKALVVPDYATIKVHAAKEMELCNNFIRQTSNNQNKDVYNKKNSYAFERRAKLYTILDDYDSAIKEYNFLLKKCPENMNYVCELIKAHISNKDHEIALQILDKYISTMKKDEEYYLFRGEISEAFGDNNIALEYYTKAIEENPNDSMGYAQRAFLYDKMGQNEKACEDIENHKKTMDIELKGLID